MFFDTDKPEWKSWLERCLSRGDRHPEAWQGIACLFRWFDCVAQHNPSMINVFRTHPPSLLAFIEHSALLRRLLNGKEPLPHPPPLAFYYPWYDLIERGEGAVLEVAETFNNAGEPRLTISQSAWRVLEKKGSQEWIATYRPDGEKFRVWFDPTFDANYPWRLKRFE